MSTVRREPIRDREPGTMTTYHSSVVRARFRQMEHDFGLVLDMLDRYRVRLRDRRATPTTIESIRLDLAVLRRWVICLQHQIDVTRHRLVRGITYTASHLRMLEDATPLVPSSTTTCTCLYRVLLQLRNLPATLITNGTSGCWTMGAEDPTYVHEVEQQLWRQSRSGLKKIERYLAKTRIVVLSLSDRLDLLDQMGAHGTSEMVQARGSRDKKIMDNLS
ncbi:hypothetical protein LTR51_008669 [Lithohypha guttulata]|nr:hypothetical protein LTR51_008669 [Lithohypha guttulata]